MPPADHIREDHGPRILRLEQEAKSFSAWREKVDAQLADQRTAKALAELERRHIDERFDRLEQQQNQQSKDTQKGFDQINSYIRRIVWLIIGAVVLAIADFILRGGLTLADG